MNPTCMLQYTQSMDLHCPMLVLLQNEQGKKRWAPGAFYNQHTKVWSQNFTQRPLESVKHFTVNLTNPSKNDDTLTMRPNSNEDENANTQQTTLETRKLISRIETTSAPRLAYTATDHPGYYDQKQAVPWPICKGMRHFSALLPALFACISIQELLARRHHSSQILGQISSSYTDPITLLYRMWLKCQRQALTYRINTQDLKGVSYIGDLADNPRLAFLRLIHDTDKKLQSAWQPALTRLFRWNIAVEKYCVNCNCQDDLTRKKSLELFYCSPLSSKREWSIQESIDTFLLPRHTSWYCQQCKKQTKRKTQNLIEKNPTILAISCNTESTNIVIDKIIRINSHEYNLISVVYLHGYGTHDQQSWTSCLSPRDEQET